MAKEINKKLPLMTNIRLLEPGECMEFPLRWKAYVQGNLTNYRRRWNMALTSVYDRERGVLVVTRQK